MRIMLCPSNPEHYSLFLKIKRLPRSRFAGEFAEFPDEYLSMLGLDQKFRPSSKYEPFPGLPLFDYQQDIARLAIHRKKFAAFLEPGMGKTLIMSEWCRHVLGQIAPGRCVLIVSPSMVVRQTIAEIERFYGDRLPIKRVTSRELPYWLESGEESFGICNWEAMRDGLKPGRLAALAAEESSMLKSHYGKWGQMFIQLGRGLEWKLCQTGTPAPNDRIEFANHAVFLDQFPTVNSFLARFFVNRGQTDNRWELKPHALEPFYRSLSHWCIFLTNPATYGWKDNVENLPPINIHIHDVPLTDEQSTAAQEKTGMLFGYTPGGIVSRTSLAQIAKGHCKGKTYATHKPEFIKGLIDQWPDESTLCWCLYNEEQKRLEQMFPHAGSIRGNTPDNRRQQLIADFQAGRIKILISKPKMLGLGLNLQIATRQVFSGLQDSYESFFQAVKRSNRIGSMRPLNVHIPVTALEVPMVDTVLKKAKRVESDMAEQERIFKQTSIDWLKGAMNHAA